MAYAVQHGHVAAVHSRFEEARAAMGPCCIVRAFRTRHDADEWAAGAAQRPVPVVRPAQPKVERALTAAGVRRVKASATTALAPEGAENADTPATAQVIGAFCCKKACDGAVGIGAVLFRVMDGLTWRAHRHVSPPTDSTNLGWPSIPPQKGTPRSMDQSVGVTSAFTTTSNLDDSMALAAVGAQGSSHERDIDIHTTSASTPQYVPKPEPLVEPMGTAIVTQIDGMCGEAHTRDASNNHYDMPAWLMPASAKATSPVDYLDADSSAVDDLEAARMRAGSQSELRAQSPEEATADNGACAPTHQKETHNLEPDGVEPVACDTNQKPAIAAFDMEGELEALLLALEGCATLASHDVTLLVGGQRELQAFLSQRVVTQTTLSGCHLSRDCSGRADGLAARAAMLLRCLRCCRIRPCPGIGAHGDSMATQDEDSRFVVADANCSGHPMFAHDEFVCGVRANDHSLLNLMEEAKVEALRASLIKCSGSELLIPQSLPPPIPPVLPDRVSMLSVTGSARAWTSERTGIEATAVDLDALVSEQVVKQKGLQPVLNRSTGACKVDQDCTTRTANGPPSTTPTVLPSQIAPLQQEPLLKEATAVSSAWACTACTYLHEQPHEIDFLSCAMCGGPRPKLRKRSAHKPPPASSTSRAHTGCGDHAHSTTLPKRRLGISELGRTGNDVRCRADAQRCNDEEGKADGEEKSGHFLKRRRPLESTGVSNAASTVSEYDVMIPPSFNDQALSEARPFERDLLPYEERELLSQLDFERREKLQHGETMQEGRYTNRLRCISAREGAATDNMRNLAPMSNMKLVRETTHVRDLAKAPHDISGEDALTKTSQRGTNGETAIDCPLDSRVNDRCKIGIEAVANENGEPGGPAGVQAPPRTWQREDLEEWLAMPEQVSHLGIASNAAIVFGHHTLGCRLPFPDTIP